MAGKGSNPTKKKKGKKKRDDNYFYSTRDAANVFITKGSIRLIFAVLCAFFAIFSLIAIISYIFTWSYDQSLVFNPEFYSNSALAENSGGKMGFLWADFLVSKLFGIGALVVPVYFGILSIFCFRIRKVNVLKVSFISIFGCIILSLMLSYIFSFTSLDAWLGNGAGGAYGYYITNWLKGMLGVSGAGLLILFFLILWIIGINDSFSGVLNGWVHKLVAKFDRISEEKRVSEKESETERQESSIEKSDSDEIDLSKYEDIIDEDYFGKEVEKQREGESEEAGMDSFEVDLDDDLDEDEEIDGDISEEDGESEDEEIKDIQLDILNEEEDFLEGYSDEALKVMFDPRLDLPRYKPPTLDLLLDYKDQIFEVSGEELEKNKYKIVKTLRDYKIEISKIGAIIGPTVTLYKIVPAPGVRVSQIKRLEEDIALSLAARGVRVITLVGTNAIGIEVANERPSVVSMVSVLEDPKFTTAKFDLPIALGKNVSNDVMCFDLAKMPHLLVAGATGQGKSVGLNAIITSLLYRKHPSEMKFVLIDPKKVELSLYSKLEKHFLAMLPDAEEPIITDTQKVIYTLKSLCQEMDTRYDLLKAAHVRNIKEYNEKFLSRRLNPHKGHKFMYYIVVIIDEFADLLMTAGREIEEPIARLAQLARAIGIHLVIATQRPTTNIITGTIKANFPARIAFRVISSIDSKTILDQTGANQLIGRGDMLISTGGDLERIQCAFIDTKEVEAVADFIGSQRGYDSAAFLPEYEGEEGGTSLGEVDLQKRDKLFDDAAKLFVQYQKGSTSMIQRKFNIGYNRAGRIVDQLEAAGIVGPAEGSKTRQVLITDFRSLDNILNSLR